MSKDPVSNWICPYCNVDVTYIPSLSWHPNMRYGYTETQRGTKQYFHYACVRKNNRAHVWPEMGLVEMPKKRSTRKS